MQAAPFEHVSSVNIESSEGKLTIDSDDLSVDPFTVLGREEADDTGNVDGETDTAERRPGGSVLVDLVIVEVDTVGDVLAADGVVHVGADTTGGDDVDGDLLVTEVWLMLLVNELGEASEEQSYQWPCSGRRSQWHPWSQSRQRASGHPWPDQ